VTGNADRAVALVCVDVGSKQPLSCTTLVRWLAALSWSVYIGSSSCGRRNFSRLKSARAGSYSAFKKETAGDVSTLQATAEPPRQQLASDRYVIAKPARPVRRQPVRARRAGAALSLEPLPPKGARARRLAWRLAVAVCNGPDATTPVRSLSGATRCGRVRRRTTRDRVKTFPTARGSDRRTRSRHHPGPRLLRGARGECFGAKQCKRSQQQWQSRAGVPCSGTARGAIRHAGGREIGASQRRALVASRSGRVCRPPSRLSVPRSRRMPSSSWSRDSQVGDAATADTVPTSPAASTYSRTHKRVEKGSELGKRIVPCALFKPESVIERTWQSVERFRYALETNQRGALFL